MPSSFESLFFVFKDICQIAILAVLLYYPLKFLRPTRGYRILLGITIVATLLYGASELFDFHEIGWIFGKIAPVIPVIVVVLFQTEIRRMFTALGTGRRSRSGGSADIGAVSALVSAAFELAEKRHGAIIAVEREETLEPYSTGGRKLDAPLNDELLRTIFYPGTPLHDGGAIVRDGFLVWAGCVFPLGAVDERRRNYGTRHRAAIGISERTDAIVIVVSEETGFVSVAYRGKLARNISEGTLANILHAVYGTDADSGANKGGADSVGNAFRTALGRS